MPVIGEPAFHTIVGFGVPVIALILLWIAASVQKIANENLFRLRTIERIVRRIARK